MDPKTQYVGKAQGGEPVTLESTGYKTLQEASDLGTYVPVAAPKASVVSGAPSVTSDTSGIRTDINKMNQQGSGIPGVDTGAEKTLADYLKQVQEGTKVTSEDQARIDAAGQSAGAAYEPLITKATEDARKGKAATDIAAGERGGFMSTQFAGIAALKQTEGKTFAGAGGVIEEQYSAYDRDIQTLRQQQIDAIAQAKSAEAKAIQTGKRDDMKMAQDMYKDAQDLSLKISEAANKQNQFALDAVKADRDYEMANKNYELSVNQYLSGEGHKNIEDDVKKFGMQKDIASLTGKFMGASTLEEKKFISEDMARKLGTTLDQKKFDELVKTNTFGTWAEQQRVALDKDKQDAANSGIDIQGAAQRIFNGSSDMTQELKNLKAEFGGTGGQALSQMVNNHSMILKEEAKSTGNSYYDLRASESNSGKLTATQEDKVSKIFNVSNQMNQMKEAYDKLRADGKTGALIGKFTSKNFTDADIQEFAATVQGVIPTIARGVFNEVGVLTDNDIKQYAKAIGGIDTPDAAYDKIFSNMLENVRSNAEVTLKNGANGGANVSRFAEDYKDFVNNINSLQGKEPIKMSSNPLLYNNNTDMKNQLDSATYNAYFTSTLLPYAQTNGLTTDDAFDVLKEIKTQSDLMKGVTLPQSQ